MMPLDVSTWSSEVDAAAKAAEPRRQETRILRFIVL
jgi:hypothetical protein